MRYTQLGAVALLAAMGSACGSGSVDDAAEVAEPSPAALSLLCEASEQTLVMWDVPGPGRPTPTKAVAPHAGALTLVEQESGGDTTVFGLRGDDSVFRVFQVTKHDDGWWPDGYRACSG